MLDLVGNPKDRFSRGADHMIYYLTMRINYCCEKIVFSCIYHDSMYKNTLKGFRVLLVFILSNRLDVEQIRWSVFGDN